MRNAKSHIYQHKMDGRWAVYCSSLSLQYSLVNAAIHFVVRRNDKEGR